MAEKLENVKNLIDEIKKLDQDERKLLIHILNALEKENSTQTEEKNQNTPTTQTNQQVHNDKSSQDNLYIKYLKTNNNYPKIFKLTDELLMKHANPEKVIEYIKFTQYDMYKYLPHAAFVGMILGFFAAFKSDNPGVFLFMPALSIAGYLIYMYSIAYEKRLEIFESEENPEDKGNKENKNNKED